MKSPADFQFERFQRTRSPKLVGEFYDATIRDLWGLALQLRRNPDVAEDLVQGTYLLAMQRAQEWDGNKALIEWLLELMVECDGELRSPRTVPLYAESARQLIDPKPTPLNELLFRELDARLEAALEKVPERYRQVLVLRLREGLDSTAIGERVGRSAGTVRSQLARGLERLRVHLPLAVVLTRLFEGRSEAALAPPAALKSQMVALSQTLVRPRNLRPWWTLGLPAASVVLSLGWLQLRQASDSQLRAIDELQSSPDTAREITLVPPGQADRSPESLARREPLAASLPGARVFGKVVDREGKGLAGVEVKLFSWYRWHKDFEPELLPDGSGKRGWSQTTDALGTYAFEVPAPDCNLQLLWFDAGPDFTRKDFWLGDPDSGKPPIRPGEYPLPSTSLIPAARLRGRVVDSEGQPIARALVTAWPGQNYETGTSGNTDIDGFIELDRLIPGEQRLEIAHQSVYLAVDPIPLYANEPAKDFVWKLPEVVSLELEVVDATQQPVNGAKVSVTYGPKYAVAIVAPSVTTENGQLSMQLPKAVPFRLTVSEVGSYPVVRELTLDATMQKYRVELPRSSMRLVKIVDAQTLQSLDFAEINLTQVSPHVDPATGALSMRLRCPPNAEGFWQVTSSPGDRLSVYAQGYQLAEHTLDAGSRPVEIQMQPVTKVHGKVMAHGVPVTDARIEVTFGEQALDVPLERAWINRGIDPAGLAKVLWTQTDAAGQFEFQSDSRPHSRYLVHIQSDTSGALQWRLEGGELAAKEGDLGVLELEPFAELAGEVLLPSNMNGAGLTVFLNANRSTLRTTLDSDGRFAFRKLPAGEHVLRLESNAELMGRALHQSVHLAPSESKQVLLDARDLGKTWPRVRFLDTEGLPLLGVEVAVAPPGFRGEAPKPEWRIGTTDLQGRANGCVLLVGPAQVLARSSHEESWRPVEGGSIVLTVAAMGELSFRLAPPH